jgi:uncharacterized NAD(P)/FAD-binding protein YdhS/tetratricopeptide (TPR) repeat protein
MADAVGLVSAQAIRTTPTVAVLGSGASGTLAAAHLARAADRAGRRVDIVLIDPDEPGRGVAYSTADLRHRLNVAARAMSAFPDDPDDFVRWLRRNVDVDFDEDAFAPRWHYGRYLADVLADCVSAAPRVRLEQVRLRATDVRGHGRRIRVTLSDGTYRPVDAIVLALGHGEPAVTWAPPALRTSPRFVADPWRCGTEPELRDGDAVVLVGAGLTALDMSLRLARPGVTVHLVSRHGMVPLPHHRCPAQAAAAPEVPAVLDLAAARRLVFDAIRDANGDWRRAVDGLRPVTSDIWQALPEVERRRFLTLAARRWDRARHRIDPVLSDWFDEKVAAGEIVVHAGGVTGAAPSATPDGDRERIEFGDGSAVTAAAVYNCTGTALDITSSADPLVMNLLAAGTLRPGPAQLGVATDERGRIRSADGSLPAMWALGPLRRGDLWESTAIPEIRVHAAELGTQIVAALPDPQLRRRPRDSFGLPLTASDAAASAYRGALERILRVQSGAEEAVAEAVTADPDFALGHAAQALLAAEWSTDSLARAQVDRVLDRAEELASRADEREQRFIAVAAARVRRPGPDSAAALLAYVDAYPEDALAVSLAVPTIAFGGATELPSEAWALIDSLAPAYGDHWWYVGMQAFMLQEQERYAEAGELAARALAVEPAAGHAVHAKAHVHYETGDHIAGLAWLDRWIGHCGARASHRAHFSWHAALHELALGDYEAMSRRYARQLAPPAVTGVRALVDSASILWRARTMGIPPEPAGSRAVLDTLPPELVVAPRTAFVAMHAALALAGADDCRGLARLRRHAERAGTPVFTRTVAPLVEALIALVHGDVDEATDGLLGLEGVAALGGSSAQREVIEDTTIHCAIRAHRLDLARTMLAERLERRESPQDRARHRAVSRELARSLALDEAHAPSLRTSGGLGSSADRRR